MTKQNEPQLSEEMEKLAVLIANMVYGYQGSDPEIQKMRKNADLAGKTLYDIIAAVLDDQRLGYVEQIKKWRKSGMYKWDGMYLMALDDVLAILNGKEE